MARREEKQRRARNAASLLIFFFFLVIPICAAVSRKCKFEGSKVKRESAVQGERGEERSRAVKAVRETVRKREGGKETSGIY